MNTNPLGDNDPELEEEYQKLGTTACAYDDWHEGQDPSPVSQPKSRSLQIGSIQFWPGDVSLTI